MARSETTIEPEKGKDTQITNNNNALTLLLVAQTHLSILQKKKDLKQKRIKIVEPDLQTWFGI